MSESQNKVVTRLVIELSMDPFMGAGLKSEDQSEVDWFRDEVLGDPELFLHSNLVGDTLGTVRVLDIIEDKDDDQAIRMEINAVER